MKLLGRDKEKQVLHNFLLGETADGPSLAVLSGEAGIGKSLLARHFKSTVLDSGGLFLEMTCDPVNSSEIVFSSALESAFELIRESLPADEWKSALVPFSDVVTTRLGAIGEWLEFEPRPLRKRASQQSLRFRQTSSRLMLLLQELAHPLALFVDDLHWADPETLELLRFLSQESELSGLRILTALRPDECSDELYKGLLSNSGVHLTLQGLPTSAIRHLVEQKLSLSPHESHDEAKKLLMQSQGNPLYIQAALLLRSSGEDICELDRHQLLVETLKTLSPQSLELLSRAACIGKSFYPPLLSSLSGIPESELQLRLSSYEEKGFLLRAGPAYEFRHDKLREVVLQLTPPEVSARTHRELGALLTAREDSFVEGVEHFSLSVELMNESEREEFAHKALRAARKARSSGAANRAFRLCRQGAQALGVWTEDSPKASSEAWQTHSELAGALCLEGAEASEGSTEQSHWIVPIQLLKEHCEDPLVLARATLSRARALARQNRHEEAVEACEEFLRSRPDYRPPPANRLELARRLFRTFNFVKRHALTDFKHISETGDPIHAAIHELLRVQLHSLIHSAFHQAPAYSVRESEELRLVGVSRENVHALLSFAVILKWKFGNHDLSDRINAHCSSFLNDQNLGGSLQFCQMVRETAMNVWNKTTAELVTSLDGLHEKALNAGEIEIATAAVDIAAVHLFFSGAPLKSVARRVELLRKHQERYRTATADYIIEMLAWAITSINGAEHSPAPVGKSGVHALVGRTIELQTFLTTGQYTPALNRALEKCPDDRLPIQGHTYFYYWLYAALAAYWGTRQGKLSRLGRRRIFRHARKALLPWCKKRLDRAWYRELLEGVRALAFGDQNGVTVLYRAIHQATTQGAIHLVALASEVVADFEQARGSSESESYHSQARSYYSCWKGQEQPASLNLASGDEILRAAIESLASHRAAGDLNRAFLALAQKHSRAERLLLIECINPPYKQICSLNARSQSPLDPDNPSSFPFSILGTALMRAEVITLSGSLLSSFAGDRYFETHAPKSVLMIPIVYRDKIEEVLYLESSDELATSAQSLLQLLGLQWKLFSIQLEREEQLERHQVLLDRTRQTRHQEALQTLALEARRNALATFLGVASHDLKAPLGAISLWASQLSDGPEKDNIEAACARATGLIHDYLDGMALELGNSIRLDKKKVDLAALVEQEIDHQLDALAPTVRGRTKLVWDLDSVDVEADAQRFRQVVANLIGNALKHCPQGTRISISTTSVEGEALLRVDDEGPGLEQSLQPDLFEAFKNTSSNNGSGLGLWIVRKIVEAHNGTVGYNALQPGSSFWVRLPAKARS